MKKIIALLFIYIGLPYHAMAQDLTKQAEKDWEYFIANRNKLCETIEECDNIPNLSLLEYAKLIDKAYAKRSQMAISYLESYPDAEHYQEALDWFLNIYFHPLFIPEDLSDSRVELLSGFPKAIRTGPEVSEFYRRLPIDKQAMELWVKKGNDLVAKVLESEVSNERKADVEMRLLSRDVNIAKRWYDGLPKKPNEADYWEQFDVQYWDSFQRRLIYLLDTYPDYVPLAEFIQKLFSVTIKLRSPVLSESYMKSFLHKTGSTNPLADRPGVKALNTLLSVSLGNNGTR